MCQLTPEEWGGLHTIEDRERDNFREFAKKHAGFTPILNIQRSVDGVLTPRKLEALDTMQSIAGARRLIHQAEACPALAALQERVKDFERSHRTTENVPLLDMLMAGKTRQSRQDLSDALHWLAERGYRRVAFIYRGSARALEEWRGEFRGVVRALFDEVYFFQVPTKIGEFEGCIHAFLLGAAKAVHRTGRPMKTFEPLFIEDNWELRPLARASDGGSVYSGLTRKQFLAKDGRKSMVSSFAKWDRVVQAKELCRTRLAVPDILALPELQKATRHFS